VDVPATAALVVHDGAGRERLVTIRDRLFIGRRCLGVDDANRLILEGDEISRDHCHIVLDRDTGRAMLIDTSTNGTRLNGVLVERSAPTTVRHGDRLAVGPHELEFLSERFLNQGYVDLHRTVRSMKQTPMCVVCGDLVDYTALTEHHGGAVVFSALQIIFEEVRGLLRAHRGELYNYVGDAVVAVWEETVSGEAVLGGAAFALTAAERVADIAPRLPLRHLDGSPLRMGWAVTFGDVVQSVYSGSLAALLGDPVNLGFRLAGIAGRGDHGDVLVTDDVYRQLVGSAVAGPPEEITVKGRSAPAVVRELVSLGKAL
jgi:adenylate cyclase